VSLVVDRYDEDWSRLAWVIVEGRADILTAGTERAMAVDRLREKYAQYRTMELRATAVAEHYRTDVDPTLPFDLIVGATLNHLLATGTTPSEADTAKMVEVVVQGLRRRD